MGTFTKLHSDSSPLYYPHNSGTDSSHCSYRRSTEVQYFVPALQHVATSGLELEGPPLAYPHSQYSGFSETPHPQRESYAIYVLLRLVTRPGLSEHRQLEPHTRYDGHLTMPEPASPYTKHI